MYSMYTLFTIVLRQSCSLINGYKATKGDGHKSLSNYKIGYDHNATKPEGERNNGRGRKPVQIYCMENKDSSNEKKILAGYSERK